MSISADTCHTIKPQCDLVPDTSLLYAAPLLPILKQDEAMLLANSLYRSDTVPGGSEFTSKITCPLTHHDK